MMALIMLVFLVVVLLVVVLGIVALGFGIGIFLAKRRNRREDGDGEIG